MSIATTLNITGKTAIEADQKKQCLQEIEKLELKHLKKLKTLAQSPKAPNLLQNKWLLIKTFI